MLILSHNVKDFVSSSAGLRDLFPAKARGAFEEKVQPCVGLLRVGAPSVVQGPHEEDGLARLDFHVHVLVTHGIDARQLVVVPEVGPRHEDQVGPGLGRHEDDDRDRDARIRLRPAGHLQRDGRRRARETLSSWP